MLHFLYIRSLSLLISLSAVVTLLCNPALADWREIVRDSVRNTDEIALVRDASGVLHFVWRRDTGPNSVIESSSISADGSTMSPIVTAVTEWENFSNPALRLLPDGTLQALFAGLGGSDTATSGALFSANGGTDGSSWTSNLTPLSHSVGVYAGGTIGTTDGDSDLLSAWAATGGVFVHRGDAAVATSQFSADQSTCCGYNPNFATDWASGKTYLGWYSNATGQYGQYVQQVDPLDGGAMYVPDSARPDGLAALSINHRIPISGRIGAAGVFVAYCSGYPSCESVNLWQVGTATPQSVYNRSGARNVNIAKGPEGRLWVMWTKEDKAYATRSNRDLTQFGRIVSVELPGDQTAYRLVGEGSLGALDMFTVAGLSGTAHYHNRVEPGLSLRARPRRVRRGGRVRVVVTDAGDPVENAEVSGFRRTIMTNASGRASFRVPRNTGGRNSRLVADKDGYSASNRVRVRVR